MGLEGEGSGWRGGGKWGERGREVGGKGEGSGDWVPPVHPLITSACLSPERDIIKSHS